METSWSGDHSRPLPLMPFLKAPWTNCQSTFFPASLTLKMSSSHEEPLSYHCAINLFWVSQCPVGKYTHFHSLKRGNYMEEALQQLPLLLPVFSLWLKRADAFGLLWTTGHSTTSQKKHLYLWLILWVHKQSILAHTSEGEFSKCNRYVNNTSILWKFWHCFFIAVYTQLALYLYSSHMHCLLRDAKTPSASMHFLLPWLTCTWHWGPVDVCSLFCCFSNIKRWFFL